MTVKKYARGEFVCIQLADARMKSTSVKVQTLFILAVSFLRENACT